MTVVTRFRPPLFTKYFSRSITYKTSGALETVFMGQVTNTKFSTALLCKRLPVPIQSYFEITVFIDWW